MTLPGGNTAYMIVTLPAPLWRYSGQLGHENNGESFGGLQHQPLLVHGPYDPLIVGLVVRRDGAVPD